jgi:hypothetical protein
MRLLRSRAVRPLVAALLVLAAVAPAAGEAQSRAQRRCIAALNAGGGAIAVAEARALAGCIRDAARGRLQGGTVAACAAADPGGRVRRATARTTKRAGWRCTEPPTLGPTNPEAVVAAFRDSLHPEALLGPDVDAAVIPRRLDRRGAACQAAVVAGLGRVLAARVDAYDRCVARGLTAGTITTSEALDACRRDDRHGRVATAVAGAERAARRRCAATAVATVFPGECAAEPLDGLAACVGRRAGCDLCLARHAAAGSATSCQEYVAGVARPFCGTRPATTQSVARQWDEELLDAIRRDTPRPTVHARNLFHTAVAMYDAWTAYDDGPAKPYLVAERPASADPVADRDVAITFAAYRLISARYARSPGAAATQGEIDAKLADLGCDPAFTATDGDAAAAVGNRIAAAVLAHFAGDGANEANDYADDTGWAPVNEPLIVTQPGTVLVDPNRWQQLALDEIVSQNGIPLPDKVQAYVSPNWNDVVPFALTRTDPTDVYVDPGPPPRLGTASDATFKALHAAVAVFSGQLDPADGVAIDISPGARGNNALGTNDGTGRPVNPATGAPYAPNVVPRGDWGRVMAEFWADGPNSETPPGHWNVIANTVSDDPRLEHRLGGTGPVLDRLEWDVKLYLAVNGAVHDAAISAWGLKRKYESVRPISAIRYMAGLGQSSDPLAAAYHPDGIPLVPGAIELITPESSAPGERHAALADHVGEVAILSWPGEPDDPATQVAGVRWRRGVEWLPYQKKTFVTPAFPGFTSGHSTFSRAAAEVLARFTGSPFFPGGLGEFRAPANAFLRFERGPTTDVVMQWATYYDASDDAGLSRLYGGIHIVADDFAGRIIGSQVGIAATALAERYFDGTAP